jgi:hypothetical protein
MRFQSSRPSDPLQTAASPIAGLAPGVWFIATAATSSPSGDAGAATAVLTDHPANDPTLIFPSTDLQL